MGHAKARPPENHLRRNALLRRPGSPDLLLGFPVQPLDLRSAATGGRMTSGCLILSRDFPARRAAPGAPTYGRTGSRSTHMPETGWRLKFPS
jgi:hypothetical protein